MSNVEMFKYYASKLNLSKPQLEAVTDCFKACFEADGRNVSEPNDDKEIYETDPSEDRTQDASFKDNTIDGMDVVNGNFHNIVANEENRQAEKMRVMRRQKFLNKALGINLAVDGICGPQTIAAEKRYKAMLDGNRQYAANQSNATANAARVKYAGAPVQRSEDTTWQKQSPHNGMRYYGDAPDPRDVTKTSQTKIIEL